MKELEGPRYPRKCRKEGYCGMDTYLRGHSSVGDGWVTSFPEKKRYEGGVRFNVISVTSGWVWVKFPGGKALCKLEWSLKRREEDKWEPQWIKD